MKEIICASQAELDAVAVDFDGRVIIKFGIPCEPAVVNRRFKYPVEAYDSSSVVANGNSRVVANGNSRVEAYDSSRVEAYDSSSVEAYGNSRVIAYGNSRVVAYDSSSVEAYGNSRVVANGNSRVVAYGNSRVEAYDSSRVEAYDSSSVEAYGNSRVIAYGNSRVVAYDSSSVEAYGNSRVIANGNSQIIDAVRNNNIKVSGNARTVYWPSSIDEYIDFYGLDATGTTVKLYKAVHFCGGVYCSDYNHEFIYPIGDVVTPDNGFDESVQIECGAGIHLAYKMRAVGYGAYWPDLAILECECEKSDVLVPLYGDGKVRARKAKVLREVPLEECGLYGEIIAKRRANDE